MSDQFEHRDYHAKYSFQRDYACHGYQITITKQDSGITVFVPDEIVDKLLSISLFSIRAANPKAEK